MRISEVAGLPLIEVFDVVQKTLDQISEALVKGDKVELRNFACSRWSFAKRVQGAIRVTRTAGRVDPETGRAPKRHGGELGQRKNRFENDYDEAKDSSQLDWRWL